VVLAVALFFDDNNSRRIVRSLQRQAFMADATILVVDDDRTIVRLCERLLARASFEVLSAMDPLDALRILERHPVHLLLSDIRMPIMDGFELVSRAKEIQPDLPVLVMTGYGSIENAIQALHRGVDGLILKPFENTSELVRAVQRVLEESRQRRDAARLHALRPLLDVTEQLLAETSPDLLEKQILSAVKGLFQAVYAGIYRLNDSKDDLLPVRSTEPWVLPEHHRLRRWLVRQLIGRDIPLVAHTYAPGTSEDLQVLMHDAGLASLMFNSVRRSNNHFAFCACRDVDSGPFTEADLEMFAILTRQAGVALENAHLYSDLKEYVRQVEDSQRALVQAEKMSAVGRLMASLAHEINNPLQAVRNALHLAEHRGLETEERLRYLELTDRELERLVTTVRRMLDFYRPVGADKVKGDVQVIVENVVALLAPQFRERRIDLHVQYYGDNRPLEFVPDQILQVLFNLLINAMDAIEEDPEALPLRAEGKEVWIDVRHEEDGVRVLVEDSGPGIPYEMRERIFEPFISTKPNGTGLGLSVSYGIMEKHQGSLSVVPACHAGGACFEIRIPLGVNDQDG
jgi:signal transduction histidine kinase/CheY-like chemotaxis protein